MQTQHLIGGSKWLRLQRLQAYFSPVGPVQGFCAKPIVAKGGLAEQQSAGASARRRVFTTTTTTTTTTTAMSINQILNPEAPVPPAPVSPGSEAPVTPGSAAPVTPDPESPQRKRSTRDIRRDVHLLHDIGWKQKDIATKLSITIDTVRYAIKTRATPQHIKAGRPPKLSNTQVDEIITWISSSTRNRRLPFYRVTAELFPDGEISVDTLRYALKKRGYKRYVALRKPPLSVKNKRDRLQWALDHVNWSINQWKLIIWSDETWVTAGRHKKTYVTRKQGEELDVTCVLQRERKPKGWMFWGCFHGSIKGIGVFWEKEWGTICKESYCEHMVPLIDGYIRWIALLQNGGHDNLTFMHDNAPGHAAKMTIEELEARGIKVIFWPAFSPDLNPIETIWKKMKDWLDDHFSHEDKVPYAVLRARVKEAWDVIGEDVFEELIKTMQQRCQSVIDAEGGHTRW